jgi:hypothetical protein
MVKLMALLYLALPAALPSHASAADDADADQALTQKLDPYIDCLNTHGSWVARSRDRYLSWIADESVGPTGSEDPVLGVYRLRDPEACLAGIAAAAELPPDLPDLEAGAAAWAEALAAARTVVDEANDYYDGGKHVEDAMAQGKALHPRLVAAYDAFDAANAHLHELVTAVKTQLAAAELERLRQDPAQAERYHLRLTQFRGRELVELAFAAEPRGYDSAAFAAKLAEYEAACGLAGKDFARHQKAGDDSIDTRLFLDAAGDYLAAAKAFAASAQDGVRYDLGDAAPADATAGAAGEGHPDRLLDRYNGFVEAANRFLH